MNRRSMLGWVLACLAVLGACGEDGVYVAGEPGATDGAVDEGGERDVREPTRDVSATPDAGADSTVEDAISADASRDDSGDLSDGSGDLSDGSADASDGAGQADAAPDGGGEDLPRPLPTFPHLDALIDANRGDIEVWAEVIWVDLAGDTPRYQRASYADTSSRNDFWPASTIKIYPVMGALELLREEGFSLDAEATFFRRSGDLWVEDSTRSFRDMIHGTFNCSSNVEYTYLLRFTGLDWLNGEFFTEANGFQETALMRGYVSGAPTGYVQTQGQRIVVREGEREWVREHEWSGRRYADEAGCTVSNGSGTANCSSPRDMAEHMRRVMLHERLPEAERFDVDLEQLDWVRFDGGVMNNTDTCGGPGWSGVSTVFPDAEFYHKGGRVTSYRLDLQYTSDEASDTHFVTAVVSNTGGDAVVETLSEEIARMMATPGRYVHLDSLTDHVNPVTADLMVYSEEAGTLDLVVEDFESDGSDPSGWSRLEGTDVPVEPGVNWYAVSSDCLDVSNKWHVRGRLAREGGDGLAYSDLHYVIVDAGLACP